MNERILVVDDEPDIQDVLCFVLENAGYQTKEVGRGDEALAVSHQWKPDIVILDIGLPGLDGLQVCPRLVDMDIPVLVLSSHGKDDQVVAGLEVGAEDYVSKPFNYRELLLRIEKIIRRTKPDSIRTLLEIGAITIDLRKQIVEIENEPINLTPTEYKILELLATHAHTPVSSELLLQRVWNTEEWIHGTEMVKVNISRLRKKIERDPSNPRFLLNRWGYGYVLTDTEAEHSHEL